MTIYVSTNKENQNRLIVVTEETEETEVELELLLNRGKRPYSDGWIEVKSGGNNRRFISYDAVVDIQAVP